MSDEDILHDYRLSFKGSDFRILFKTTVGSVSNVRLVLDLEFCFGFKSIGVLLPEEAANNEYYYSAHYLLLYLE